MKRLSDLDVIKRLQYARGRASDVENVTTAGRATRESQVQGAEAQAAGSHSSPTPAHSESLAEPPTREDPHG